MFKRLELHNHTRESDGSITCNELIDRMIAEGVDAFAITDHNTTSGQCKIRARLEELGNPIDCIYGMEYTTYYGHILCLNLHQYVPWENINKHKPELLFQAAKDRGAIIGPAHPFSFGDPFARGCRFEMTITDYSAVDFIEIMNNPEPLHHVNKPAKELWEKITLEGEHVAATAGMDLHGKEAFEGKYATFIEGEKGGNIADELETAIKNCRTWVSKGPLLLTNHNVAENCLEFSVEKSNKSGFDYPESYQIVLKTASGDKVLSIAAEEKARISLDELEGVHIVIPELYGATTEMEDLYCVSPAVRL